MQTEPRHAPRRPADTERPPQLQACYERLGDTTRAFYDAVEREGASATHLLRVVFTCASDSSDAPPRMKRVSVLPVSAAPPPVQEMHENISGTRQFVVWMTLENEKGAHLHTTSVILDATEHHDGGRVSQPRRSTSRDRSPTAPPSVFSSPRQDRSAPEPASPSELAELTELRRLRDSLARQQRQLADASHTSNGHDHGGLVDTAVQTTEAQGVAFDDAKEILNVATVIMKATTKMTRTVDSVALRMDHLQGITTWAAKDNTANDTLGKVLQQLEALDGKLNRMEERLGSIELAQQRLQTAGISHSLLGSSAGVGRLSPSAVHSLRRYHPSSPLDRYDTAPPSTSDAGDARRSLGHNGADHHHAPTRRSSSGGRYDPARDFEREYNSAMGVAAGASPYAHSERAPRHSDPTGYAERRPFSSNASPPRRNGDPSHWSPSPASPLQSPPTPTPSATSGVRWASAK